MCENAWVERGRALESGPCWGACADVFAAILKNPTAILASGPCILPNVRPTHTRGWHSRVRCFMMLFARSRHRPYVFEEEVPERNN